MLNFTLEKICIFVQGWVTVLFIALSIYCDMSDMHVKEFANRSNDCVTKLQLISPSKSRMMSFCFPYGLFCHLNSREGGMKVMLIIRQFIFSSQFNVNI